MSHAISTKAPEVVVDAAQQWERVRKMLVGTETFSPLVDFQIVSSVDAYECRIRYAFHIFSGRSVKSPEQAIARAFADMDSFMSMNFGTKSVD
jgi:hypothetical protein